MNIEIRDSIEDTHDEKEMSKRAIFLTIRVYYPLMSRIKDEAYALLFII